MDVFREILREIENDKMMAQRKQRARKQTLDTRLPRVAEIENELSGIGITLAQMILSKDNDELRKKQLSEKTTALIAEKEQLLYENGYDESYFTDMYKCKKCQDTGFVESAQCACLKQRVIARYFEMSNLGSVLDRENFDAFSIEYYSEATDPRFGVSPRKNMERIWEACLSFEKNFGKTFQNLFFYGETGLGKTFLSSCIAKELLARGFTVLYTTAAQLFRHVEDARFAKDKAASAQLLKIAYEADLLIIDDLGTEFITTITVSELFSFINTRMLTKRPTIISTNLSPQDLEEAYIDRITSRIFGEYTILRFIGDDIRIAKKRANR